MKLQESIFLILFICLSCNHVGKNENINSNTSDSTLQTAATNDPISTDLSIDVPVQNMPNSTIYSIYGYRKNILNAVVFNENTTIYTNADTTSSAIGKLKFLQPVEILKDVLIEYNSRESYYDKSQNRFIEAKPGGFSYWYYIKSGEKEGYILKKNLAPFTISDPDSVIIYIIPSTDELKIYKYNKLTKRFIDSLTYNMHLGVGFVEQVGVENWENTRVLIHIGSLPSEFNLWANDLYVIDANDKMSILDSTHYVNAEDYSQETEGRTELFLPIKKMNGRWALAEGGHSRNFIDHNLQEFGDTIPFPENVPVDRSLIVAKRQIHTKGVRDRKGNYIKDDNGQIKTETTTIIKYYFWNGDSLKLLD